MTSKPAQDLTSLMALDNRLTPEQVAIKKVVQEIGEKELRPNIAAWYESGE